MLTTREYTRLYAPDGTSRDIKPNVEFEPFEGEYTVGSYARIKDTETDEIITLLPGQKITSVGTVAKPQRLYLPQEVIDEYIKTVRQSRVKVEEKPKPKPKRKRKVKNEHE